MTKFPPLPAPAAVTAFGTVAERIDPTSPHYDPEFAKLREAAYQAWDDHLAERKVRKAKKR